MHARSLKTIVLTLAASTLLTSAATAPKADASRSSSAEKTALKTARSRLSRSAWIGGSFRSRVDPAWVAVYGYLRPFRPWAAWLEGRPGAWKVRVLSASGDLDSIRFRAPKRAGAPCDTYPAFSEPLC